ncbi:VOC family protein [Aquipuribacter sp. SD81]|uniref:VOC family protein n=1 Tax=Aquipuribacter sp. SD81 TaxID=3127703 RepID=UPI003018AF51
MTPTASEHQVSARVQVSFDAADPPSLARFWALALGYVEQPPPPGYDTWDAWADEQGVPAEERDGFAALVDPAGRGPRLLFQRVPEAKSAKNRVHLDVTVSGPDHDRALVDARVRELEAAGGRVLADRSERGERWVVMADPEGNELCVQ